MATNSICSLDGCGNAVLVTKWGLCGVHYRRMRKYGDANIPSPRDVPRLFYEGIQGHAGDACVEWTFSRSAGYAVMSVRNHTVVVSRALCEDRHGPPPHPNSEAAHSCGHSWCVNPMHVSWKSPKENSADRIRHQTLRPGTRRRFISKGRKKLNAAQVETIAASTSRPRDLASAYGVCVHTIRKVKKGRY